MYSVLAFSCFLIGSILVVNLLQEKRPSLLPSFLRSWNFLPLCLRSLEPMDRVIRRIACCSKCFQEQTAEELCEEGGGDDAEKETLVSKREQNGNLPDFALPDKNSGVACLKQQLNGDAACNGVCNGSCKVVNGVHLA